jgi:aminoacyl tRNA synthase complex-interacting multifunctional protein 1
MSSNFLSAIATLKSPVKELVGAVTENGKKYVGETETDQKEVVDWIVKSSEVTTDGRLKVCAFSWFILQTGVIFWQELNAVFLPRTYAATNYFTAADVALYGNLFPTIVRFCAFQN